MGKQEHVPVMKVLLGLAFFCAIAFVFWHAGIAMRLEFSSSNCQENVKFFEDPIEKIEWLSATTLRVHAYGVINCCNKIGKGWYQAKGNTIILKYQDRGNDPCDCVCGHELRSEERRV